MVTDGRADFRQFGTGCGSCLERKHTVSRVGVRGGGMSGEHQTSQCQAVESGEVRSGEGRPQEQLCVRAPVGGDYQTNKQFQSRGLRPHQAFHLVLQA